MRQKIPPAAAPGPSGGLTWVKLQLSSFTAFRDSIPVLSAPATQAADGLITWPCNAPSDYSDLRECASHTMPIADLATIVGLSDATTLVNGSNVIHVRMTCSGEKNMGVMAAYLDRPANNQASAYGVGVGCYRNTSGAAPKLIGAAITESTAVTGGAALLSRSPYATAVLQHPIVNSVNHYGGHIQVWEYDAPAYVQEGGISYTREIGQPLDLVNFGIAAWSKAGGSGIAGEMTSMIEVAVQSSADWSQAPA